jgi:hypothetical protein
METSKDVMHGTGVYSTRVSPKDPALKRFPDIKKINKKPFNVHG